MKLYYKNFLVLFTGSSIGQAIPFLLAPIVSRIFSPKDLAVQENFLTIVSLISIVAAGRYEMSFVLPREDKRANNLFALSILIAVVVTFFTFFTYFIRTEISNLYHNIEIQKYVICLGPAVLLLALNNIFIQMMVRAGKYSLISGNKITQSLVQNVGYIVLGYWGFGITGLITAWILGNLFSLILLIYPTAKIFSWMDISSKEISNVGKEYKDFPLINSLHAFSDIFVSQFLLYWLITRNYGMECLGLFAIMIRYIRAPLNLIGGAVGQLYYQEASTNKNQDISLVPIFNKSVKIVALAALPLMLIIFFFGPEIFSLYLGQKWMEAGKYASIMAPAILFNFLTSAVSTTPLIYQKQKTSYLLVLSGYILSLGVLLIGASLNYNFKIILAMYSATLSIFYISMFFWYRGLINQAIS